MSQSQTGLLYAFSILAIFLVLAALYESWSIPISVLLALPLGVIGGVLATSWRGLPNDVYFQIGLLTVLGLTTKNAILIVQFAKIRVEQGASLIEATLEGAKLRLRPIVMTSLAFGFGVLPLAIASGAGAGAQKAIGTSVLGGMMTATFLAIFFIPSVLRAGDPGFRQKAEIAGGHAGPRLPEIPSRGSAHECVNSVPLRFLASRFSCAGVRARRSMCGSAAAGSSGVAGRRRNPGRAAGPAAAGRRPEVAGVLRRSSSSIRDRAGAGQQPRSADGLAQYRKSPGFVPDPERRALPHHRVLRPAPMPIGCPNVCLAKGTANGTQVHVGLGTASWELDLFGRIRSLKSRGLGAVPGDGAGAFRDSDLAGGCRRQQLPGPGRRSGKPQAGPGHSRRPAGLL